MGGVGKTALAVQWAHQARSRFADGELYVDLCGFHPHRSPLPPDSALGQFLIAIGVPGDAVPTTLADRIALYRSLLAQRRMLVLLDNAHDAEQVRPLLPGAGSCTVLVTSRSRMAGLVAREGLHRVMLDVLTLPESMQLLRRCLGAGRIDTEPEAAETLAELCGHHPLALRVAAERVSAGAWARIADAVGELGDRMRRLEVLSTSDDEVSAVRAVISWSYQALPERAQQLFRLLGLHTGPDIDVAAGNLVGAGDDESHRLLGLLVGAHLVEESGADRYRMHDLIGLYARERALADDHDSRRAEAVARLSGWYLHGACAARAALDPHLPEMRPAPAELTVAQRVFADRDAALAWFETERENLVSAITLASEYGLSEYAWQLPTAMFGYFLLRSRYPEWVATHLVALEGARRCGDREAEGRVLCNLGNAYRPMRRLEEAAQCYELSLQAFDDVAYRQGQAKVLGNLALTYEDLGRLEASQEYQLRALALFGEIGDRYGEALCLTNLGCVYTQLGRYSGAVEVHRRSSEMFEQLSDPAGQARARGNLGAALRGLGRLDEAVTMLEAAVATLAALGDDHQAALNQIDLADILAELGRPVQAEPHVRQALAVLERLGDPRAAGLAARLGVR
jgi:tetratricopeptide (TPR) repeat protein